MSRTCGPAGNSTKRPISPLFILTSFMVAPLSEKFTERNLFVVYRQALRFLLSNCPDNLPT